MTESAKPSWRDLIDAINGVRADMQAGFQRIEDRVAAVEHEVAEAGGNQGRLRFIVPVLLSVAALSISLAFLLHIIHS